MPPGRGGRFIAANERFLTVAGCSRHDLIGRHAAALFTPVAQNRRCRCVDGVTDPRSRIDHFVAEFVREAPEDYADGPPPLVGYRTTRSPRNHWIVIAPIDERHLNKAAQNRTTGPLAPARAP